MTNKLVRVRFAPSPTGNPHVGNFRTALYNYLFAKNQGGTFLLRFEDTDRERSREEYVDAILESMAWLGTPHDEEPVYQSQRIERHKQQANRLLAEGKAYRCRMTPEELDALRESQKAAGQKPMYNGRDRDKNYPDDGTPYCVRLKTPQTGATMIHDHVRGDISVANEEIEDFIILRSDGTPTYNFAVVIDDIDMEITHVMRGDDHISNTLRQSIIYRLLEYPLPEFIHLPQILGEDKARLSKRHGATGVLEYRDQGFLPEALMNYLARLGWSHGDQEFFTPQQLCDAFTLSHLNRSSAVFDSQKLIWLNGEHIRACSIEKLVPLFKDYCKRSGFLSENVLNDSANQELFRKLVECTQERSRTLQEMVDMAGFLFQEPLVWDEKEARKSIKEQTFFPMEELATWADSRIETPPTLEEWEQEFQRILEKHDMKMRVLAQAVRIGATGTKISPPIFNVMELLGPSRLATRLRGSIDYVKNLEPVT